MTVCQELRAKRKGYPGNSVQHLVERETSAVVVGPAQEEESTPVVLLALTAWHLSLTVNTGDPRSLLLAFCQMEKLDKLENSEMEH